MDLHDLHSNPEQLKHHDTVSKGVFNTVTNPRLAVIWLRTAIRNHDVPVTSTDRRVVEASLAKWILTPVGDERIDRHPTYDPASAIDYLAPLIDELSPTLRRAIEKYRSMLIPNKELQDEEPSGTEMPKMDHWFHLGRYLSTHDAFTGEPTTSKFDNQASVLKRKRVENKDHEKEIVDQAIKQIKERTVDAQAVEASTTDRPKVQPRRWLNLTHYFMDHFVDDHGNVAPEVRDRLTSADIEYVRELKTTRMFRE